MQIPLDFPYAAPPAPGEFIEIAPGVRWLRMPLPFALDHINVWLIREGEGWALVDAGFGDEATRALWERHFAHAMEGRPLLRILCTHYHPDHLGNAQWLAERFATAAGPLPVEMSLLEFLAAHAVADNSAGFSRPQLAAFFHAHGLTPEQVDITANRGNTYTRGVPTRPPSCTRIAPGDALKIGGDAWLSIVGYGHTPEHLSFYSAGKGLLISGDMLLPKISTNVNVWPVDPDADAVGAYTRSLQAFRDCPDDTLVLPSHGLPFRGINRRIDALEAHHEARMNELYGALQDGPKTAAELIPTLFRRALDNHQLFFAIAEAVAHVNHGWREGRLRRELGADGRLRFHLAD